MEVKTYIEQEELELKNLKERLEEINHKWFQFKVSGEKKFLDFLINKKEIMLKELKEFNIELTKYKQ